MRKKIGGELFPYALFVDARSERFAVIIVAIVGTGRAINKWVVCRCSAIENLALGDGDSARAEYLFQSEL